MKSLKVFCKLLILTSCFYGRASLAALPDRNERFQQLESPSLKVLLPGEPAFEEFVEKANRYPWWAQYLLSKTFAYKANESLDAASEKCNSQNWSRRQAGNSGFWKIANSIEKYVQECESEIQDGWDEPFSNTYKTMMAQIAMDPQNYPRGRFVLFNLPGGIRLKGFLALHDPEEFATHTPGEPQRKTARPLIIFRTGIFSNASEFLPERYLFRQLFEQSQFNMLILESNSGQEYIHRNRSIALGGFDEGIQNFQIAKLVQDPSQPISKHVTKVHLLGMSFGGHGVFYAALLNDLNRKKKQKPVVTSAFAFCPLVNYRDTLDAQLAQGLVSRFIEYWTRFRMKNVEKDIPGLQTQNFLASLIDYTQNHYQGPRTWTPDLLLPQPVTKPVQYWQANDFWQSYQNVQTPMLVFATEKDPLVFYELNSKRLMSGYINTGNSNLKVISFPRGYHCSFPGAYKWQPIKTLVEQYFLSFE